MIMLLALNQTRKVCEICGIQGSLSGVLEGEPTEAVGFQGFQVALGVAPGIELRKKIVYGIVGSRSGARRVF